MNVGDKGSLTWAVAELRSEYDDEVLEANEVYMDAMEVLTDQMCIRDRDSGTIPFKELSFVKLVLYKWLSFEFIIQLFS